MSSTLFRQEVLNAQADRWLGGVRLAQSIPFWVASAVVLVLAACLVAYGIVGTYTRKAHVSGILTPQGGEVNVAAAAAGRVVELRVKDGDTVGEGDVLLILNTDHATTLSGGDAIGGMVAMVGQQIEARRQALRNERGLREAQARVRSEALRDRLRNLDSELAKLDDEVALQERRKALAEQSVKRYEELAVARFVSPTQVQTQQEALIDQDGRLRALERARLNLRRERAGLVAEGRQVAADLAATLAATDRDLAAMEQEGAENAGRRTTVVTAPKAGIVSAVAIGVGQWVSAGQTLAALHPEAAPLEAQLYAPSRTAGFVAPGQEVLIRYAAYPYQKFGLQSGKVVTVSQSAFATSDLPPALQSQFGRQNVETLYRVTVALDAQSIATYGEARPLKAGMALEADIVQDKRTIVEWMLEPLFAVAKRT